MKGHNYGGIPCKKCNKMHINPIKGKHIWKIHKHPRGMLGKKQSEKFCEIKHRSFLENNPMIKKELREKVRLSKLGKKRQPFSEEWKENLRKSSKELWKNKEYRNKILSKSGFGILNKDKKFQEKRLKAIKEWHLNNKEKNAKIFLRLNKDENFIKKRLKGLCKKPTKPERYLITLIKENSLPYKYVGNGKKIIGGLNPDFVDINGKRKIIEVFNRFWHQDYKNVDYKRTEIGRINFFNNIGYSCLIIWDDEINKDNKEIVLNKIINF